MERRGERDEKRAPVCMRVQLLMSVCIGYERSVERGGGERPRVREENAPKDPRRTKWSPLILRRTLQSASFSGILAFLISHHFFLVPSLSLVLIPLFLPSLFFSPTLSLFTLYLLPPVQVFPHANAKSTELLRIIAAPGLDSRREYISSTLGGKLCPWSRKERREGAQRFLVCETFLWTRYGLLSFANAASRIRGYTESSRKSREYARNVSSAGL